jgi:hypothetical protein
MNGYSPERSGSDLLMQSAGLLILCHMREETTGTLKIFSPGGIVEDCVIAIMQEIHPIVGTVRVPVKSREAGANCSMVFGVLQSAASKRKPSHCN